ncbi:MAG: carbon starvation protein A [candidate division Zixibacteria bacterium HGW-Zixibacteria-1]|nr:MAG: carbon starvation protein A [candidate division Zixibacteria bacterium HGW-Zixibacteria-1]
MNILYLFLLALICFILGYRFYARFIASRLGEDPGRKTPAVERNDGVDYVPTRTAVLFAHHYATIAGAGPIIGPTLGILYGVGPAWLWIVIGGIFFGAVHDFSALFASIRENGSSMAEIARKALGESGFLMFIIFTSIMLLLVTSAFLSLTAVSLTSIWPIDKLGLDHSQTLLKTKMVDGGEMGIIGGIASTSVIIITAMAPLLGFLIFRKSLKTSLAFALAMLVCIVSIYVGFIIPVQLPGLAWMIILSIYVLFAAGLPVWVILQPRDFINVQILYAGLGVIMLAVIIGGFNGLSTRMPMFNLSAGNQHMGPVWPILFIIIACGAISGFHALVAGGTSSKQLARESDARKVGFGAMILESILAILVVLAIASSLKMPDYMAIAWPTGGAGNPVLAFALSIGHLVNFALGIPTAMGAIIGILMVEGFVVTTLDSAVRLNRYIFEEFWARLFTTVPPIFRKFWFNSGLAVILMFVLAVSNGYKLIWPVFGASNQLLAALTLIAVTVWLNMSGRKSWFTLVPAVIMVVTTIAALIYYLFEHYIPAFNVILIITDIILLILSIGVIIQSVRKTILSPQFRKAPRISS